MLDRADCADFGCHNSIRLEPKHFLNTLALTFISFSGRFVFAMQKHYLFFFASDPLVSYMKTYYIFQLLFITPVSQVAFMFGNKNLGIAANTCASASHLTFYFFFIDMLKPPLYLDTILIVSPTRSGDTMDSLSSASAEISC